MGRTQLPGDRRPARLRREHRPSTPCPRPGTHARGAVRRHGPRDAARLGRTADMKEIFDRHAEELTPAERRAIWGTLAERRAAGPRPRLRWALSTAAALTAGVMVFAVVHRGPRVDSVDPIERLVPPESTAETREPAKSPAVVPPRKTRLPGARAAVPTASAARSRS